MKSLETDAQFEVTYTKPYGGPLDRERTGRWFVMPDEGERNGALVWTDGERLGWWPINDNIAFLKQFNKFRYAYKDQGLTADEAFDSVYELAEDSTFDVPVETGLLSGAIEEFDQLYSQQTGNSVEPNATYGVTMDDDDVVLDLIKTDPSGTFVREGGQWVALDFDVVEDSDIIDGKVWADAFDGLVDFFDANSGEDLLTKSDILPFIKE